ncbi:MAG: hypothetical protein ACRC33_05120 [Gemmataceae bacterium]
MTTIMRSARGASAFTDFDYLPGHPIEEASRILSTQEAAASGRNWDQRIDDLLALRQLEDDWDGQGAEAPHPALVDGAIKLVLSLRQKGIDPALRAIAGLSGTVYLEWQTCQGYCEIEVLGPLEAEHRWLPLGKDRAEVARLRIRS